MAQWHRHVYLFMSLCYVGRHSYFCNANMPILFPICQYNDINIIAEHCICQLPLSETLVRDERKIGSRDIVFVFVKQLTCHSSRRLGQTVPCPPRVRSLGAAQLGRSRTSSISTSTPSPDRAGRGGGRLSSQATQRPGGDQARRHLRLGAPALPHYRGGSGEDFKNMNALDRYDKLLRSGGLVAKSS